MSNTAKPSVWQDITTDYKTGHTVFKDWAKAWSFVAGLIYLFFLVPAVIILTLILRPEHDPVVLPLEIGVVLLGNGVSIQAIKEVSGYYQRKTKDADGPLVQPGEPPKPLMPQPEGGEAGVTG